LASGDNPLGCSSESGAEALWTASTAAFCTGTMRVRLESLVTKKIREKPWKGRFHWLHQRNRGDGENIDCEWLGGCDEFEGDSGVSTQPPDCLVDDEMWQGGL
jgi:hypothetical protein